MFFDQQASPHLTQSLVTVSETRSEVGQMPRWSGMQLACLNTWGKIISVMGLVLRWFRFLKGRNCESWFFDAWIDSLRYEIKSFSLFSCLNMFKNWNHDSSGITHFHTGDRGCANFQMWLRLLREWVFEPICLNWFLKSLLVWVENFPLPLSQAWTCFIELRGAFK